ncbi:Ribonuclease Rh [Smittium mucronatum]|uniref:ribonuclease T2 n=1 Tax=Smittium mucronatum TaxID=133383 RepID=A0A1R0H6W8_9FUNG|nr:Ribonuclease Rh [Smittium mucronatum]
MFVKSVILFFLAGISVAQQFANQCPINSPSCSLQGSTDTCCVAKDGWIVYAEYWIVSKGPSKKFTIHGLWPDRCDGTWDDNGCDLNRTYTGAGDIVKARDPELYRFMDRRWPSTSGSSSSFWDHEWNKHGTCLTTIDPPCLANYQKYDDLLMYFKITTALSTKYDFYKALSDEGIVPGATYTRLSMEAALFKNAGVRTVVRCNRAGTLTEIWSYFDILGQDTFVPRVPDYNPTDCQNIYYPPKTVNKCL